MSVENCEKLKIGIIGLGVGMKHFEACCHLKEIASVVAVADFDNEKLEQIKSNNKNVRVYKEGMQLIEEEDLDIIVIASYDNYHYEQAINAANKGMHLFVEKPLCLHKEEAILLKEAIKRNGIKFTSNLILRESPRFIKIKKMIDSGDFGEIYFSEFDYNYGRMHKVIEGWRGKLPFYSAILGGGVHMADLMYWFLNEKPEYVYGVGNNLIGRDFGIRFNDFSSSLLRFPSGKIVKLSANFSCVLPHFHHIILYGSKATFQNDYKDGRLYLTREEDKPFEKISEPYPGVHKGELLKNFILSVKEGRAPLISAEDIFTVISICFAIDESIDKQKEIKINYI